MLSKQLNISKLANVKTLVILALLASLSVFLETFLGINSGYFKLHFAYLPVALAGMLYGIAPAILVAAVADILSNLGTGFSFVFVLLAVLEGAVYGMFLHKELHGRNKLILQAVVSQLVVSLIIHAGLNTWALWQLFGFFNPVRFIINAVTYPVKVFSLFMLLNYRKVFSKFV
ncbi:MAG: folate family ECF transporter S component [Clostridiales bacterium]|nr:folate family ECF transporter S component [Clostridiales bacterium]